MTPTSQVKILPKKGRNGRIKEKLKNNTSLYLLLAPATILLILFAYVLTLSQVFRVTNVEF